MGAWKGAWKKQTCQFGGLEGGLEKANKTQFGGLEGGLEKVDKNKVVGLEKASNKPNCPNFGVWKGDWKRHRNQIWEFG